MIRSETTDPVQAGLGKRTFERQIFFLKGPMHERREAACKTAHFTHEDGKGEKLTVKNGGFLGADFFTVYAEFFTVYKGRKR